MKAVVYAVFLAVATLFAGCSTFTTVSISSARDQIEARREVIATFCLAHGYRLSNTREPIRGYNRYSSDSKNQLVRAWERSADYPTIYEFWREGRYVVLIDTGPRRAMPLGEELKKKLAETDPALEILVDEHSYFNPA